MNRQKSFDQEGATLYVVATPIGNLDEMTFRSVDILKQVDCIAAEDTRNTIKLLNHFSIKTKMISHHEHNKATSIPKILAMLKEGKSVALVSDAGYPAISDPGYELVRAVVDQDIPVVAISGANACLDALVVSGILPQPFLFYGFLSQQDHKRKKELMALQDKRETIVLYEAPHRYQKTLADVLEVMGDRDMALCRELTKRHEEIIRGTVREILNLEEDLKGEMVLVIAGNQDSSDDLLSDAEIIDQVNHYIQLHMSVKDAIKQVAEENHLHKNKVYSLYHKNI